MILEYSQLLSTAHRVLDGEVQVIRSARLPKLKLDTLTNLEPLKLKYSVREKKLYTLRDPDRNKLLYKATHMNHPSAVWVRKSFQNYKWLHQLLTELCIEYTYRYGRIHKCQSSGLVYELTNLPANISTYTTFSEPTPAMPEYIKVPGDSLASYRKYYVIEKAALAVWTKRPMPYWYRYPELIDSHDFSINNRDIREIENDLYV